MVEGHLAYYGNADEVETKATGQVMLLRDTGGSMLQNPMAEKVL